MTQADDEARPSDDDAEEPAASPPEEPAAEEQAPAPDADAEGAEPAADEASSEAAPGGEEPAGDAAPSESASGVEEPAAAAESSETAADDEAAAESAADAPEQAAPEQRAERRPAKKSEGKGDVVPGADLEPIAIGEERELSAEERAAAEAEAEERAAREARAAAVHDDEEITQRTVSVPADAQIQATGKRKSAVARVIVRSGSGAFQVNDRNLEDYFPSTQHQSLARQPLVSSGYDGNVDVRVRVHGGGISGQAGAVRHGVARALTSLEPELRGELKRRGMLTRDERRKERKKAGLKKARKRPQFSKR